MLKTLKELYTKKVFYPNIKIILHTFLINLKFINLLITIYAIKPQKQTNYDHLTNKLTYRIPKTNNLEQM